MGQSEQAEQRASSQEQTTATGGGLGLGGLSMNEVPPAATVSEEEAPRQGSRAWLLVLLVLAVLALVGVGARFIANVAPGQEAELRLRKQIEALPAQYWQKGDLMQAQYLSGSKVRLEFSPRLRTGDDADRELIRQAMRDVLEILRSERPNRDLHVEGYQGGEQIATGEYRSRSTLVGPGGEQLPDIFIRVRGDPEGGIQSSYSSSSRARR